MPDIWEGDEERVSRSADDLLFPAQDSTSSTDDFIHDPCHVPSCDYSADEYNVSTSPFGSDAALPGSSYYAENDSASSSSFGVWELASLGTMAGLISIVTIIGNLIVILSFILERSIRQMSNYFIASLAVSDLLIGCISMPLYTVYLLSDQTWLLGEVLCDLWLSLDYTLCLCSIYTVFCITIDRYCSVTLPARYRKWRTERKVVGVIAVTWLVPVLVFFPSIMGWQYFVVGGRTVPPDKCYVQYMENALFNCLLQIGYFWATLVVMCALYAGIYRVARRLHRRADARRRRMVSLVSVAGETITRIGIGMTGSAAAARRGISIPMLPLGVRVSGATVVTNRMGTTTTTILGRKRRDEDDDDDDDEEEEEEEEEKGSSSQGFGSESGPETPQGLERCWRRKEERVPETPDVVRRKSLTTVTRGGPGGKDGKGGRGRSSSGFLGGRVFTERAENQYMLLPTDDVFEAPGEEMESEKDDEDEDDVGDRVVGATRRGSSVGAADERMAGMGGKRVIIREIRAKPDHANAADRSGCYRYFAKRDADHKSVERGMERSAVYQRQLAVDAADGEDSAPGTKDKQSISRGSSRGSVIDATLRKGSSSQHRLLAQAISRAEQRRRIGFEKTSSNLSFSRRRTQMDAQQVVVTENEGKVQGGMEEETGRDRTEGESMTDGSSRRGRCHQLGRQNLSSGTPVNGGSLDRRTDSDDGCQRLSNGGCGGRVVGSVDCSTKEVVQGRDTSRARCIPIAEEDQDQVGSSTAGVRDESNGTASRDATPHDICSARSVCNNAASSCRSPASEPTSVAAAASDQTRRHVVVTTGNHLNPSDAWNGTSPATTRCLPLAHGRDQATLQRVSTTTTGAPGRGRWRFSVLRQWSSRKHRSRFLNNTTSSCSSSSSQKTKHENHTRKSVRTITIILGAFVVCWTPWHVLSLIMGFCSDAGCVPPLLYDISYWLCYLNSPLNPLCYAFANQQFKKAFVRILKLDWRRN